jgi:hypothetical protein
MATQFNPKSNKTNNVKVVPPAAKAAPKPVKPSARNEPSQEEIQTRAFEIYVSEGCREGSDLENWLRAEKELRSQGSR